MRPVSRYRSAVANAAIWALTATMTYAAPPLYRVTSLGQLPGNAGSFGLAINNAGDVVGFSGPFSPGIDRNRAFLWQNGSMVDLGDLPGGADFSEAYGINDVGQKVGISSGQLGGPRAVLWQNSSMVDLGDLPGGIGMSEAYAINDRGQVVGYSVTGAGTRRAVLWQKGGVSDLGHLPGGSGQGGATAINNAGQVVGYSYVLSGTVNFPHAVLWQNDSIAALGELPGASISVAYGINEAGQVVGYGFTATGGPRAVVWQNGSITVLSDPGGDWSAAYGINEAGQIVGFAGGGGGRAALWQNGSAPIILDAQIDPNDPLFGNVLFSDSRGINDLGQIVVQGHSQGRAMAYLLTPVPEPSVYAMLLGGLGLLGLLARNRERLRQAV